MASQPDRAEPPETVDDSDCGWGKLRSTAGSGAKHADVAASEGGSLKSRREGMFCTQVHLRPNPVA